MNFATHPYFLLKLSQVLSAFFVKFPKFSNLATLLEYIFVTRKSTLSSEKDILIHSKNRPQRHKIHDFLVLQIAQKTLIHSVQGNLSNLLLRKPAS